jgi:antitoxin ChpS
MSDSCFAQCDASAALTVEVREWLDAKPVGGELL